jgi:hypothetical protein
MRFDDKHLQAIVLMVVCFCFASILIAYLNNAGSIEERNRIAEQCNIKLMEASKELTQCHNAIVDNRNVNVTWYNCWNGGNGT